MKDKFKKAIEEYQCSGCVRGSNIQCYEKSKESDQIKCSKHVVGTSTLGIGRFLLGMPKGFNRVLGNNEFCIYGRFLSSSWVYDKFNVPVWKHLTKNGHTLVRGVCPRINTLFIHVFLEDCISEIDCLEITQSDIYGMD